MSSRFKMIFGLMMGFWVGAGEQVTAGTYSSVACHQEKEVRALSPVLQAESVSCLDSVQTKNSLKSFFIHFNEETDRVEFLVVESQIRGEVPVANRIEARIPYPDLFQVDCRFFLMGGRLLPGSKQVALLYSGEVIQVMDYSGQILKTQDPRSSDGIYSCVEEIPMPDSRARVDDVKIIASQRKIRFTVTDYKNHVFSECKPLSDPERKNLQDELPWQTDLLKNTQSLLESAYDEDDRIGYQSSINLISQSIKGIQHALSTGKLCKISPRKVQRSLQY